MIMKAQVVQLNPDGTAATTALDGFTYAFYDAAAGCPPGTTLTTAEPTVKAALEAQHQLIAPRVVPAGKDRYLNADGSDGGFMGVGIPYVNSDAGLSNASRKLYMKLTVPGTAAKAFGVFMGIQHYRG
jgi:hypothetical protein